MSYNPKMIDLIEAKYCFFEHEVEVKTHELHLGVANIEYKCNTCGKRIYLSYILDGVTVWEFQKS